MQGQSPLTSFASTALTTAPLSKSQEFFIAAQALCQARSPTSWAKKREQQRRVSRKTRSISISVQPLTDSLDPRGELFWVVSRDISVRGIGLISNEPFEHHYVSIGLLDNDVSVIGEVRHNTSIGSTYPLYLVGIEYVDGSF